VLGVVKGWRRARGWNGRHRLAPGPSSHIIAGLTHLPASLFSLTVQDFIFNFNPHLFRQLSQVCLRRQRDAILFMQIVAGFAIHGSICTACRWPRAGINADWKRLAASFPISSSPSLSVALQAWRVTWRCSVLRRWRRLLCSLQLLDLPQGTWLQYHIPIQRPGCNDLNDTLFSRGNVLYTTALRAPLPA
jgi:hypothetical protein